MRFVIGDQLLCFGDVCPAALQRHGDKRRAQEYHWR